jgi:signal transduction histidine kinase
MAARENLELQVRERTQGLTKTNALLENEILERKHAEGKLSKAKEEAEEATRLKDRFVSLVAHDLRSPLTVVIGFLKLLQDEASWERRGEVRNILNKSLESGEHMADLIENVLNISKLKAGKITLSHSFLDAHFIADRAITALAPLAEKKKIRVENNVKLKTRIYADPTLFYEVIQNLLTNAIKFCSQGGTITVFVPNGKRGAISVGDNGVGIAPEMISRLFSFETKSSTPGTAGEKGTGLGLPLSNDIMLAHGGTLEVESEKGKGSIFHITLPVVRPVVLVVDDEAASRFLFIHYLKSMDVEIIEAESGRQALDIINNRPVHLIISDINMPGMDGYQLLEKIRANPKTVSLPFIALTSESSMEVREKAFQLGADDFVNKVVEGDDFTVRIGRFVG